MTGPLSAPTFLNPASAQNSLPFEEMKRWITRIMICLILGAVTTVAVAWGLAFHVPQPGTGPFGASVASFGDDYGAGWYAARRFVLLNPKDRALRLPEYSIAHRNYLPGFVYWIDDAPMQRTSRGREQDQIFTATGWPLPALCTIEELGAGARLIKAHNGIVVDRPRSTRAWWPIPYTVLPLRPLPLRFLLNVLFFATVWLLLGGTLRVCFHAMFGHPLRDRRVRHGRCPQCAYDLRDRHGDGCPECGWGRET